MATRLPASQHTREELTALIEGRLSTASAKDELVKLATRLIVEEALEGEAGDALGREYYEHGAQPGQGYRNGYRTGRLKTAEGLIDPSPSSTSNTPNSALHSRVAFASMASKTDCSSPGEFEMTRNTSAVAVCCSNDSLSS